MTWNMRTKAKAAADTKLQSYAQGGPVQVGRYPVTPDGGVQGAADDERDAAKEDMENRFRSSARQDGFQRGDYKGNYRGPTNAAARNLKSKGGKV